MPPSKTPRSCALCKRTYRPGYDPDPCLGELPGVMAACCGHGDPATSYVMFDNGMHLSHFDEIKLRDPAWPLLPRDCAWATMNEVPE